MKFLFNILGVLLVIEGIPYFAFPEKMKDMMHEMEKMPPATLRWIGFVSMLAGVGICYLAQRTNIF
ncbi:MAG: DUF2065 domain-containing protein [Dissulfurimicrobium sp.]|uniref:DUF2065 domain-containing protein n=2 Tax=Dissulfurimicrobium sp. TaxID=2022436 RepID=UPI00404AEB93